MHVACDIEALRTDDTQAGQDSGPSYAEVIRPQHIRGVTMGEGYESPDLGRSLAQTYAGMRGACADVSTLADRVGFGVGL